MFEMFHLGFSLWLLAQDQGGLFFRILTSLCIFASIFHRLVLSLAQAITSTGLQKSSHVTLDSARIAGPESSIKWFDATLT